ncbi:hypothetical protein [Owenweeksia hongkongensis]|uniref:hypothetical protein n=1 Tax=Owenweeksia hongkongensis TaxID=253245 RepID=UPI003A9549D0
MAKSEILRKRLEVFISKYYKNQLIKGAIYGVSLSAMYFFFLAVAEYFGRFGSGTRLTLLIGLIAGLLAILGYYILYPLSKLLKVGKRISYQKAAQIIGKHFPEVDDKLLNAIQLETVSGAQSDLIQASIDQKIENLSPVPFTRAVDFSENKKYWPILVIPALIFIGVFLSGEWTNLTESGRRIAEFNREFVPAAPFQFVLLNDENTLEEGQNVTIKLQLEGDKVPAEASLMLGDEEIRMNRGEGSEFSLTIPEARANFDLRFKAAGFLSKTYHFEVLPVPQLQNVRIKIIPPSYTGLAPSEEELRMVHDVPEGSQVIWVLGSRQAEKAWFVGDTSSQPFEKLNADNFKYEKRTTADLEYAIDVENNALKKRGLSGNKIHVVKDAFPDVKADFDQDSLEANVLYYSVAISDDYGFSGLSLVIEEEGQAEVQKVSLKSGLNQRFGNVLDLDSLAGDNGKTVKVYFKVSDNDRVNGAKTTSSEPFVLDLKGKKEREEDVEKGYKQYFQSGKQEQQEREELKKSLEEMRRALMEKKSLSFKEKSKLKDLLEKQQELLKKQQQNEELLEKLKKEEEKLDLKKEELKEEEKKIDELSEKDKEIEDLMKEIEDLMEKLDTDKLKEKLDELQKMNKSNERTQERKDELLKDLKFKKDVLESAEKLKNLSEEMKELSEKTGNQKEEAAKQDEIKEEFEKVAEKLEEMKEENEDFKKESEEQGLDESKKEALEEMQKSSEKMQKQDSEGANENQKKSGEKMQEMSESLGESMMSMQSQSNKENIETLRQILENLETVSFGIEDLANQSRSIGRDDPGIKDILTEQKRLIDGAKLIEDSLLALASRAPQIQQLVFDELDAMKENMDAGIKYLQEVESARAASHQQYVMTAANNLALMLEQSLRQMQQMQAQMTQGQQQCQKPGSKPDGQTLKEMQGQIGKMMDRLKEGQQKGEGGKMSKEMVETISKQEQLREALEEMQEKEGSSGSKGNRQKAIEELKKMQDDLMDGKIADNYKERLKDIETRLLESEKAELKQKQDETRESTTADKLKQLYTEELEKYLEEKGIEEETLDKLPVEFRNYYKGQTSKYLSVE